MELAFERIRKYSLKMNILKCVFGVSTENFLEFLVRLKGIEIDKNKARAITELSPPKIKKNYRAYWER